MNAPNEIPSTPPAPSIDPSGSCSQVVAHREWTPTDAKKLVRALTKIAQAGDRPHVDGVRLQSGNAIATDGHRLLCVIDYCRAEHVQGHTYTIVGAGFGLFGDAVSDEKYPDWEHIVPKLGDVKHSLEISFTSVPKVSDYTPVSIKEDGIALGLDPGALVNLDLRYLSALPRTDGAFRLLVIDRLSPVFAYTEAGGWFAVIMPLAASEGKQSLVMPFAVLP